MLLLVIYQVLFGYLFLEIHKLCSANQRTWHMTQVLMLFRLIFSNRCEIWIMFQNTQYLFVFLTSYAIIFHILTKLCNYFFTIVYICQNILKQHYSLLLFRIFHLRFIMILRCFRQHSKYNVILLHNSEMIIYYLRLRKICK